MAVAVLALRVLGPEQGCTHAAANFDANFWARTPLKRREIITKMHRSEKWSLAEGAQSSKGNEGGVGAGECHARECFT